MIYTIGVYGFSEDEFFGKLVEQGVKTFWDVRSRRGVRGKNYRFVNSTYLQAKLKDIGISYRHVIELAPSESTRDLQRNKDKQDQVLKSQRVHLGNSFKESYLGGIKDDTWQELSNLIKEDSPIVLFCVEKFPSACHRSLAGAKLSELTKDKIVDILPEGGLA